MQNNLDHSLLEQDKVIVKMSKVFLMRDIIQPLLNLFQSRAAAFKLNLSLGAEIKECYVEADATRIKQILVNLLDNAIKFTKPNKNVTLNVHQTRLSNNEKHFVIFSVTDEGIGLK